MEIIDEVATNDETQTSSDGIASYVVMGLLQGMHGTMQCGSEE